MCLYLHTDMYVEQINTRWHERICPYQIFEKTTYTSKQKIFKNNSANTSVCMYTPYIHMYIVHT